MKKINERGKCLKEKQPQYDWDKNISQNIWLNTQEVSTLIGVTTRTIQNYRDQGILPFSQIGRIIRYRADDIQDFLMAHYMQANITEGGMS